MKLPHRDLAYVPIEKLLDYLLSESHFAGKSQAKFFRAAGFDETNADLLRLGLVALAQSEDVREVVSSSHGVKYIVEGPLTTPTGTKVRILTVWIIDAGQDRPRFVTAYPA